MTDGLWVSVSQHVLVIFCVLVGVQWFLPAFSCRRSSLVLTMQGIYVQITHGGRERVMLCGRLRGIHGKDGARGKGEVQIKMRNGGEREG